MMELFPYQKTGADWLGPRRFALLADEMGLGKTPQALVAALRKPGRVLVVCPGLARNVWVEHAREWGRSVGRAAPAKAIMAPKDALFCQAFDVVISSYEGLRNKIIRERLHQQKFETLIIDEAHYLKNPKAQRTARVFGPEGIARGIRHVWMLTGTPASNHPGELWIYCRMAGLTELSPEQFTYRYCEMDTRGKVLGVNPFTLPELRGMMAKISLRRLKKDVLKDLPPLMYASLPIARAPQGFETVLSEFISDYGPPSGMAEQYQRMLDHVKDYVRDEASAEQWLTEASMNGGRDLAFFRQYTAAAKVQGIADTLADELGRKEYPAAVVFHHHQAVGVYILAELKKQGLKAFVLNGTTPHRRRDELIADFQAGKYDVAIPSLGVAATAITLTRANQAVFAELSWVPADNLQAVMRLHRIGQKNPVTARVATLDDSVDTLIQRVLLRKTRALAQVWS